MLEMYLRRSSWASLYTDIEARFASSWPRSEERCRQMQADMMHTVKEKVKRVTTSRKGCFTSFTVVVVVAHAGAANA
ncbi:hypothetical protein TYRP_005914 [Tyrophagus putrescentiae]|nr:hypothetical protein TYRP_005914 [Tyrophagus putrescentiae]